MEAKGKKREPSPLAKALKHKRELEFKEREKRQQEQKEKEQLREKSFIGRVKALIPGMQRQKEREQLVKLKAMEMIDEAERKNRLIQMHGRTNETLEESLHINSLLVEAVKAKLDLLEDLN